MLFATLQNILGRITVLPGPHDGSPLHSDFRELLENFSRWFAGARIIAIPDDRPQLALPKQELWERRRKYLDDLFYLPQGCAVAEDKASCVVLLDFEPGACGVAAQRFYCEIQEARLLRRLPHFGEKGARLDNLVASLSYPDGSYIIAWGTIRSLKFSEPGAAYPYQCAMSPGYAMIADELQVHRFYAGEEAREICMSAAQNAVFAVEEIAYFLALEDSLP
jgi:hypothetical protein